MVTDQSTSDGRLSCGDGEVVVMVKLMAGTVNSKTEKERRSESSDHVGGGCRDCT